MKSIQFVIALFILSPAFSQNYHPLVVENNRWNEMSVCYGALMKVCGVNTTFYRCFGDVLIDTCFYKGLYISGDSLKTWNLAGYLREDIDQKKVWFRNLKSEEGLLYDFSNLYIGKKIALNNAYLLQFIDTVTVVRIDTIIVQSQIRKMYYLKCSSGIEKWIEGIGSDRGLLKFNCILTGANYVLLCFKDDDIEYVNPDFQSCYKKEITPAILNKSLPSAKVNVPFYFKIETTEIFPWDSVYFGCFKLPEGLQLDKKAGVISGIPKESGVFSIFIYSMNHQFYTDVIYGNWVIEEATSGLNKKVDPTISVYPNPAKEVICINIEQNRNLVLKIFSGNNVLQKMVQLDGNTLNAINLKPLTSGIYLVQIEDARTHESLYTTKLVLE